MNVLQNAWLYLTRPRSVDPDEARPEYMTRAILSVSGVVSAAATVPAITGTIRGTVPWDTLAILLAFDAVFFLGWALSRSGRWRLGRYIPLAVLLLAAVYGNYIGGMGAPAMLLYILAITIASMLFGRRALVLVIVLSLAAFFSLAFLHYRGIITAVRSDSTAFYNRVLIAGATFLCVGILLRFLISQLEKTLQLSRSRGQELQAMNEELEATNEELQATMEQLEAANRDFELQNERLSRINRDLDESEKYNRVLFADSNVPMVVLDPETGRFTDCNDAAVRIYGFSSKPEVIGLTPLDVSSPDQYDGSDSGSAAGARISEARAKGALVFPWRHRRPDGIYWDAEVHLMSFTHQGRSMMQFTLRDITDHLRSEREREHAVRALLESEQKYRRLIESMREAYLMVDMKGLIIETNRAYQEMLGYSGEELLGIDYLRLTAPGWDEQGYRILQEQLMKRGYSDAYEMEYVHKDGRIIPVEMRTFLLKDDSGNFTAAWAIVRDITERKQAESEMKRAHEALRESEERLRGFIEQTGEGVVIIDEQGTLVEWNPSCEKITGIARGSVLGRPFSEIMFDMVPEERRTGERRRQMESVLKGCLETGTPAFSGSLEVEMQRMDGSRRITRQTMFPIRTRRGFMLGALVQDITEQHLSEKALRESEYKFRTIFETAGDGILILDAGRIIDCNERTLSIFAVTRERIIGLTPADLSPERQADGSLSAQIVADQIETASGGERLFFEWIHLRGDGTPFHAEISLNRTLIEGRYCLQAFVRDVTGRKEAEEKIRQMNLELEQKVEERTRELRNAFADLKSANADLERTIRNLNETQQQLVQSEKMAALGQLVAGVAHEMNTPLGAIISSNRTMIDLLREYLPGLPALIAGLGESELRYLTGLVTEGLELADRLDPGLARKEKLAIQGMLEENGIGESALLAEAIADLGIRDFAGKYQGLLKSAKCREILVSASRLASFMRLGAVISVASEKAAHVVGALRRFISQDDKEETAPLDVHAVLDTILTLYENKLKYGIELRRSYEARGVVLGSRNGLGQVWMNLLNNALQAMDYRGSLEINTRENDGWTVVSIIDSGAGISEGIRDRIFEPFFTTKKAGEGIGLGLDISRRIVEKLGGSIEVDSVPGRTQFIVRLRSA